uniref:5-carboxymethyl-2-hydroxymuconate isomerase n=1 Tax=Mycobacterium phage Farewell TaxID=3158893 RepID=A0AAU8GML9_9CAUD
MPHITIEHPSEGTPVLALYRVLFRLANRLYPAPGCYGLHSVGHIVAPTEGYVGRHRAVEVQG